jgi:hypothetical protein
MEKPILAVTIPLRRKKAEKVYFYLWQQFLRNTNLDLIFSKSRSGTIANKKNYGSHPLFDSLTA